MLPSMKYDKKEIERFVKGCYSGIPKDEWKRLKQDPYHQIEFIVTSYFLEKYLPMKGLVLDAGGGPGRYTVELAKKGYEMVLLDYTPEMLELAEKRIRRAGVKRKVKQVVEGTIEDLSDFSDATFDAVICLGGPLNHLLNEKQRKKAARELVRVAKKGAPVFVSVISRIGLLKCILVRFPSEMRHANHHWEVGDYIPGMTGEGFTATHWFLPEDLRSLFEKQDVKILEMAGLQGLSTLHIEQTNALYKDKRKWKMWLNILLKTCTHPAAIGASEHFLLVCRKRK
jgi:2-polyprenyl-3-methyl-5-hydroxy-6-metoxy-1,4-benzoquinol methylase